MKYETSVTTNNRNVDAIRIGNKVKINGKLVTILTVRRSQTDQGQYRHAMMVEEAV